MEEKVNKEIETKKESKWKYEIAPFVIFLIGLMTFAAQFFGYMEAQLLNTYIDHVLNIDFIFVAIMVSCSATMGLIFLFVFGVLSDNTRNEKYGRRAPFLLIGWLGSGIGMILFGFSFIIAGGDPMIAYIFCFFFDVVIIGIFSNAFYAAQRILVADLVEQEYRGRVNGIVSIFMVLGLVVPIALTLIMNEIYTAPNPDPNETGNILTLEGHIILLTIGGLVFIICGILGFFLLKNNVSASELPPKKKFKEEIKETFNLKELKVQKEFFKLILAMTIYMAGVSVILSYLFNFIFSLGLTTMDLAMIVGVIAAPIVVVFILLVSYLTDKVSRKKIIPPTILISCIGFIMIPLLAQEKTLNIFLMGIAIALVLIGIVGVVIPMNT